MSESQVYLAVDLGASSGRVVAGLWDGRRLALEEVHRFDNGVVPVGNRLYWDILALWKQVLQGLSKASQQFGDRPVSIGVDTWGVDFGLLGDNDELLANPYSYRDRQTADIMPQAFKTVDRREIFSHTGLQFMEFNSLYQLLAMKRDHSPALESAKSLLMIPDLFHWMLTGVKSNEYTNATTTQFFDPQKGKWATELLSRFGLPTDILGAISEPGTVLGTLTKQVASNSGLRQIDVVLPGTHDTASAVMSVPAAESSLSKPNWAYISSGTWSLMGVEIAEPITNEACQQMNFTNEGGVGRTIRLLKNIAGLWLVQECRRIWQRDGHSMAWSEMVQAAEKATPLVSVINPDDPRFVAPENMPSVIQQYCGETGQTIPRSPGQIIRCVLESLALRYRVVLDRAERLCGSRVETIHVVGGGSQNQLLCQMTADACNRHLVAGPVEATAIGNIMMQAVARGAVSSIWDARMVVRDSFQVAEYDPRESSLWDDAYAMEFAF